MSEWKEYRFSDIVDINPTVKIPKGIPLVSDTDFVYYLSRWEEVRDHAEHNLEGSSGRQRVAVGMIADISAQMERFAIRMEQNDVLYAVIKVNLWLHL